MSPQAMQLAYTAMPVARRTRYSVSHIFKGIPLCHEDGSIPDFAPSMGAFFLHQKLLIGAGLMSYRLPVWPSVQGVATLS